MKDSGYPGRLAAGILVLFLAVGIGSLHAQEQVPGRPTVHRDGYGVPHVLGPTDASVVFGAAWVQAEEDWPMVERNFVRATGRAAELLGESSLADDYIARALEISRFSREEYERSSPRMRGLLEAYADGFNAYLEAHPEERNFLDHVEPWHTLALIRFKYHQLEFLAYAGFEEEYIERLLEDGWAADGEAGAAVTPASTADDLDSGSVMRFAETLRGPMGDIPLGSNEWALGPSRTADGTAMLLVNPHQSFFGVERYVEIHLHSDEGLVFSGLTRFGFLLPYMGNNARLGWTYTDNYADISDLYVERFDDPAQPLAYRYGDGTRTAETWTETVKVKVDAGTEERTLRFWKTHHGPVVGLDGEGRPLTAKIAMLEEGGWFAQLDAMIRSKSLEEFRTAVSRLSIAYMNLMYADQDGNIWYLYGSAVPRRDPSFAWRDPVDGSDPRTEWGDYHPVAELPQVLNPSSGWLLNTNSSPFVATDSVPYAREDFPSYMIGEEENNARAVSSRRVLEGLEGVTFDDFARAVWDTRLSLADSLVPVIAAEWEALGEAGSDEIPAALAPGAPGLELVGEVVEQLQSWYRGADVQSIETTWFVLSTERWFLDRRAQPQPGPFAHLEALAVTLEGLERDWGRTEVSWGEVNHLQRPPSQDPDDFSPDLPSLPIAGAPSAAGSVFVFHTDPAGSTGVRYGVHGNSFVKVIEFGPTVRGRSLLVFGQSGDPDSPHFFDQAALYSNREFKPAWFTREEVEANAVESYQTAPKTMPQSRGSSLDQVARADSVRNSYAPADVEFMTGMIHHHGQALLMARMAPTHGASGSLQVLTGRIINGQNDEIALMQRWLRDRGERVAEPAPADTMLRDADHAMHMPGMLSEQQLEELDAARGPEFDRLFLTFMIQHHQGALTMVNQLFDTYGAGQGDAIFKIASDIGADQTSEIDRMRSMLREILFETTSTP